MATGRPTEYSPELLKKAEAYLKKLPRVEVVHSLEGLARHLGISKETIYDWSNPKSERHKPDFSDIVSRVRIQKSIALQNGGLANRFNAKIAALLLGHEGYRERQEHTGEDGQPIQFVVSEATLKRFNGDEAA